ncbi:glycerophosphodiester phosphodiesterase [Lacimicrobium alkaliphilum]|uniref:glycerophosphodiester phosphodiesterase n=1 Tax=Lacimicrobium alkaliphilum TaxID=1526571 RepID=A0ABQ1R3D3_9ALTE|nr:glycerophosphodiester phosphodiesterase [Lacimicrobium alkaliphilum]GGD56700.1 glycerophosphodiester phosphodiesterase [Lacimicrobium alkaliphilum]
MSRLWALSIALFSLISIAEPLVIAHRGASGYLPEHTLEAAILAHAQGADYIEQDLVLSKEGIPVVLHDIHLDTVTDVARHFPDRAREDGRFYVIDFTLSELKRLRVHERRNLQGQQVYPNRYQGDGSFRIATFGEQLALIRELNRSTQKQVGWYPEIKAPAFHRKEGLDISKIVLTLLREHNLDRRDARIFLQCFDFSEIKRLRTELGARLPIIQLIGENSWQESATDYTYLQSVAGLKDIARYAQGIGPWLPQLVDTRTGEPLPLVRHAKTAGLAIHPYTLRVDDLHGELTWSQWLRVLHDLGVDGVFTDFPDRIHR